jgi:hypothetical protein
MRESFACFDFTLLANCTNIPTFPKSEYTVKFYPMDIPLMRLKSRRVISHNGIQLRHVR